MSYYVITDSLRKRFENKVDKTSSASGCWLWTASCSANGYGQIGQDVEGKRRNLRAHRVAYVMYVGPVPDGMDLDHVCRNRACVNPAHLEPVTRRENARRGIKGELTTHCPRGHEYDAENTGINTRGHRYCRTCLRERARRRNGYKPHVPIMLPIDEATRMYHSGATIAEIAAHFEVSDMTVYGRLKKAGVTMRRRGTRTRDDLAALGA